MFTSFHLMSLLGVICGTVTGASCGWCWFGPAGLLVGTVAGFVLGAALGELPFVITTLLVRRKLVPMTADELRCDLHTNDRAMLNFILLELNHHGEDISIELPFLFTQLTSDDGNQRANALAAMQSVFPEYLERVPDYRPFASTDECRDHAEPLRQVLDAVVDKSDVGAMDAGGNR